MIVFVHGVPETSKVWAKVQAAIGGESVALALPGFGCARPDGFGATMDEYVDWLVDELSGLPGPIDLVGHDWGAALTYRVASAHGALLRSWVADVGNIAHPAYEWHAFAQLLQTPVEGEAFVAGQVTIPPEERAPGMVVMGVPEPDALDVARDWDATMSECVLALYRSAVPNLHHHWGPWSPTRAPGLILHPSGDPFSDEALASEVATALGARFERLDHAGHFWPYQAPDAAAALLEEFWGSVA